MSIVDILPALVSHHFTSVTIVATLAVATWAWRKLRRALWLVVAGAVTLAVMLFGVQPALPNHPEPPPLTRDAYR
jgi:hypothetical protein